MLSWATTRSSHGVAGSSSAAKFAGLDLHRVLGHSLSDLLLQDQAQNGPGRAGGLRSREEAVGERQRGTVGVGNGGRRRILELGVVLQQAVGDVDAVVGLLGAEVAEHALGAARERVRADPDRLPDAVRDLRVPVHSRDRVHGLARGEARRQVRAGEDVEPEELVRAEAVVPRRRGIVGDQGHGPRVRAVQLPVVQQVPDERRVEDRLVPRLPDARGRRSGWRRRTGRPACGRGW